jgi:spore maturation protein CgeB
VRLFEAGACGVPVISDRWDGIEDLLVPGREIILADTSGQVIEALAGDAEEIGLAARAKILSAHTAAHRAAELETYLTVRVAQPA